MQKVGWKKKRFKSGKRKDISYNKKWKILNKKSIDEKWENATPPWSPSMKGKVSQSSKSHKRDESGKRVYDLYSSPLEGCWKRSGLYFVFVLFPLDKGDERGLYFTFPYRLVTVGNAVNRTDAMSRKSCWINGSRSPPPWGWQKDNNAIILLLPRKTLKSQSYYFCQFFSIFEPINIHWCCIFTSRVCLCSLILKEMDRVLGCFEEQNIITNKSEYLSPTVDAILTHHTSEGDVRYPR